ncbi:MAG: DUF3795 domain-containing protein [Clostridia bacterium]|nr:DUF3795 domain-containing protein [Clostridia bacterium]
MHWAYCGYDCERCLVYRAAGDEEERRCLALRYSTEDRPLRAEQMRCSGCRSAEALPCVMCEGCELRICAVARGVESCGRCGAYPCDALKRALPEGCESRKRLDEMHSGAE